MNCPLICTHGLIHRYPGRNEDTLKDIDLSIHRGEFVAIVGISGSGKTTLLNILALLDHPVSGTYCFGGQEVSTLRGERQLAAYRQRMGFVFQSPFMLENFNAAYNLGMSYRLAKGRSPRHGLVRRLMKKLDLEMILAERTADRLSGGQRQRVAIGRAVIHRPEVVFADEPTASLDLKSGGECIGLLQKRCQKATSALILVTHQPEYAAMAQRCLGLRGGQIAFDSTSRNVNDIENFLNPTATKGTSTP